MPKLFTRKYMRGEPRLTERIVGVSVLALSVLMVGVFLLTSGLLGSQVNGSSTLRAAKDFFRISEQPLFVPAPENMKPPAAPHEIRVAEAMLPVLPEPWKRLQATAVRVEPAERAVDVPADWREAHEKRLPAMLDIYGAGWTYRGVYQLGDDEKQKVAVAIADAARPDAAFGLWRSMLAKDARSIPLGSGGWIHEALGAAAFWSGRYYTEVIGPPAFSREDLEAIARAVASLQINYGRPFWAESVLPVEGQVENSLLYVRQAAMGLDELSDCWLAEYPEGVTLGVLQPKSPEKTLASLRTRFEQAAKPASTPAGAGEEQGDEGESAAPPAQGGGEGEGGYGGEGSGESVPGEESAATRPAEGTAAPLPDLAGVLGAEVVSGRIDRRVIVAYPAGPYLFVAAAEQPAPMLALAKSTRERWALAGTAQAAVAAAGPRPAAGGARFPDIEGGSIQSPQKIERYTDNLYEKIDGREGMFRAFNFVELRFAQYLDARRQKLYDVYLYDMAEPNNALGIYMREKSGESVPLSLGRDGYLSGANAYYYKSKYYVNVLGPAEPEPADIDTARRIATAIAETITDAGGTLWAESLLPAEGRTSKTLDYIATSALGYDFLDRAFMADYEAGGKRYRMFIHKAPGAAEAKELFAKYAEAAAKYDKVVGREPGDGGEMLVSDSLGVFAAAFHKGPYLAGVVECDDKELAVRQAELLRGRLNANDAGEPAPPKPAAKSSESSSEEGGNHGY